MADSGGANPALLTLPDSQAALAPFPPGCPVLVSGSGDETSAAASPQAYLGQVHSVYIDLGSTTRDNFYRVRPSSAAATELRSAAESALKYAPGCTVTVDASALPPFVTKGGGEDTRDATIISCVGGGVSGSNNYYLLDVVPGPSDSWTNIQSTVPMDSVRYRAPTEDSSVDARAPGPALAPAAAQEPPAAVANDDNNNDDQGAWVISPHPHTIPADGDGSSLTSSPRAPPVSSITIGTDKSRKRSAEQLDCDEGSSTLSPMPTDGSISIASSDVITEQIVRRIDIPDTVDASKIKGVLVGPDCSIKLRMQAKFRVTISLLGLDDVIGTHPDSCFVAIDECSKLGPISYKVGDKCIMIQGSERKVHDAAKVVIHMLVNKCYAGNDKDMLMRKLRVVRQVRKKAKRSPRSESGRAELPSPTKRMKTKTAAAVSAPLSKPVEDQPHLAPEEEPRHDDTINISISGNDSWEAPPAHSAPGGAHFHGPLDMIPAYQQIMGKPSFDGGQWHVEVKSPLDPNWNAATTPLGSTETFKRIIGEGGSKKKEILARFKGACFFCLRGGGIYDQSKIPTGGSLRVYIKGLDLAVVESAAGYFSRVLSNGMDENGVMSQSGNYNDCYGPAGALSKQIETKQAHSVMVQQPTSEARALFSGRPLYDEQSSTWFLDVFSPLNQYFTFGCLIGEGSKEKQRLIHLFDRKIFFCLRGDGIQSKNAAGDSRGPLRVFIQGPDPSIVISAAEHIAHILLQRKRAEDAFTSSNGNDPKTNNFGSCGGSNGEYERDGPTRNEERYKIHAHDLVGSPNFDDGRQQWNIRVDSPLAVDALFDLIIGLGGSGKREILKRFPHIYLEIFGEGVRSSNGTTGRGPLHVLIRGRNRDEVVAAAKHTAQMVHAKKVEEANGGTHNKMHSLIGEPVLDEGGCYVKVWSSINAPLLFDTVLGRRGEQKDKILVMFPGCSIGISGRGAHGYSDDPLHVRIAQSRSDLGILRGAAELVAKMILSAEIGQSSNY